jgi:hypothetical protein
MASLALVPERFVRQPIAAIVELAGLLIERHAACAPRLATSGMLGAQHEAAMARLARLGQPWQAAPAELTSAIRRVRDEVVAGPLGRIVRGAQLADCEVMMLAVLAAAELDDDVARLVAWTASEIERRRPDVGFIATLIGGGDAAAAAEVRRALHASAPLVRTRLVIVEDGGGSTARDPVRLADRVIGHLLGDARLADELAGIAVVPPIEIDALLAPQELAVAIDDVLAQPAGRAIASGPEGVGKATIVAAVAATRGLRTLRVDAEPLLAEPARGAIVFAALAREALLTDVVVLVEVPVARPARAAGDQLATWLAAIPAPVIAIAARRPEWLPSLMVGAVELAVPLPSLDERTLAWVRAMPDGVALAPEDARAVAIRYACGVGAITRAAQHAAAAARRVSPSAPRAELAEVSTAARAMFGHRLGALAERIPAGFAWSDLVVAADAEHELREIVEFARALPAMLERGWDKKLPYGRGVSAILAGPPGTGKTMAAQLLAGELGYELYRIDLSQVVDKFIGETEKNIARLFDEAEGSHAILFFDEADALFAKRTEVRSSNDRYANLEVNYLLQRMESYAGTTLLATNLEHGLDEALRRRVRFTVQLELPDEPTRAALWQSMFPPGERLARIDWSELGRRYEMSGGYIKKAAVRAAAIAATRGDAITLADLHIAARAEYRSLGRIA